MTCTPYVIVFKTASEPKLDEKVIQKDLLAYYGGLAKAVSRGVVDPEKFELTIVDVKQDSVGSKNYAGKF